jgi:hypothetical protein
MNREQAVALVAQLGPELGGDPGSYSMDERGEAHFVFKDQMGVMIRHERAVLVIACTVGSIPPSADPSVFAELLGYQFLGLRTLGAALSWNSTDDGLLLSRMVSGEPTAADLARELGILLRTAEVVQEEVKPILEGRFSLAEEPEGEVVSAEPQFNAFNRA